MQSIVWVAKIFSSVCFLYYGLRLLLSEDMLAEFKRYGLSRYRRWIGALQLAGSLGLVLGAYFPFLPVLAALGLSILMGLGIRARTRVGDTLLQMVPAIILFLVNTFIFFVEVR